MEEILYVIELKDNKYYVSKTKNVPQEIREHVLLEKSRWTKKYPLKKLLYQEKLVNF